jgi:hypothetical protein
MADLRINQVLIGGKVVEVRPASGSIYTQVILPAPDEYTSPQRVEIVSKRRIGNKDDQITQVCDLGGFLGREFTTTDKDTGEKVNRRSVNMVLRAVE